MRSQLLAVASLVLFAASLASAGTPEPLSNLSSVFGPGHVHMHGKHRCKVDQMNHTRVYDSPEEDMDHPARTNATHRRSMQEQASATYEPIRILVNTDNIDTLSQICTKRGQTRPTFSSPGTGQCKSSQVLTKTLKTKLQTAVNKAVATIQNLLSVVPLSRMPRYRGGCDVDLMIPSSYKSSSRAPTNTDFVLFLTAGIEPSQGVMAWALWCDLVSNSNPRPAYGHFNMNVEILRSESAHVVYLTAVHEIYHALGFESYYMTNYMGGDLKTYTIRGRSANVLTGTNMKREVRRYFGCNTAKGAEIEEGGGSGTVGSHLEARLFKMEVMAGEGDDVAISRISLAFFADMGVYQVDWANAMAMYWGKDMGCGFLHKKCDEVSAGKGLYWHFPKVTSSRSTYTREWNCDWDRRFIGQVIVERYSQSLPSSMRYYSSSYLGGYTPMLDYCPSVLSAGQGVMCTKRKNSVSGTGESFGATSQCWPTSGIGRGGKWKQGDGNPRCYQKKCSSGKLMVKIGSKWVTCPQNGGEVSAPSGYSGSITCPRSTVFCVAAVPSPPSAPAVPSPPTGGGSKGSPGSCLVKYAGRSRSVTNRNINFILKKINTVRMAHWDVAVSLPLMKWNSNLASMADSYVGACPALQYQSGSALRYKYGFRYVGQMLSGGSSSKYRYFSNAIKVYLADAPYYSVPTNKCSRSGGWCDEYIQLINKNTLEVGCGYKYCRNPTRRLWLCNFGEGYQGGGRKPFTLGEAETDQCQYQ